MRKFLRITILFIAALMLSITGCISESDIDPPTPIDPDAEHTLQLRILQSAATRGVNRPVQDNEPLALLTGDLYLVHQTGIISHHFQIVAADNSVTTLTDANRTAGIIHRNLLTTGISLPNIPGTVTSVVMVGNYQGTLPTGSFVSNVGSRVLDIISQHDAQGNTLGVNLFGEDELTPLLHAGQPVLADDGSPIFTASIFLRPTVARFEIADITAAGSITAFTIDGIFIDGFYRQMRIDGTLADAATPFFAGVTPASFTNTTYGFDTNFAVHDWRAAQNWTGSAVTSLTVQAGGTSTWHCSVANETITRANVWGYQLFAQSHAHTRTVAPPSIVIRLSGIETSCDRNFPDPQFVTVGSFMRRVEGVHELLTEILAGRIYRIPAGNLVFDEHDLSPLPNNLEIEVQIEISLDLWNPEDVLPDAPLRQSNPQSVSIYEDETHTFALGAAWGGGCLEPIVYLWEQSADGINWEPAYGINNEAHYTTTYVPHNMYFRRSATRCGATITSAPALVTIWFRHAMINGIRWATRNVDYPNTFEAYPHSAGRFFQWGTLDGETHHWPVTGTVTGWNNSSARVAWTADNQPCPAGWRLPTQEELSSLGQGTWYDNWNGTGVAGRVFPAGATPTQIIGAAPTAIFLPAAGFRHSTNGALISAGTRGIYSSGTPGTTTTAHRLSFVSSGSDDVIAGNRAYGYSVRCVFTESGAVQSVTLDITDAVLFVGETQPLVATVIPGDAFNQSITWSSNDTSVATVNANGVVTAVSAGTAIITVTTVDGGHTAQALVTVHTALATPHPTAPAAAICSGATHTFNLGVATGGYGTITYQWQSSTNGTVWTDIAGATGQNLTTTVTASTHFRRVASNLGRTVISNGAQVTTISEGGVLIGGIRWASCNVNMPNTFAAYPHSAGRFFQFGTIGGTTHHWPVTGDVTGWNSSNNRVAWTAANQPCPAGWRLPTTAEITVLHNDGGTWHNNWNGTGVNGRVFPAGALPAQVTGTAPTAIFLPAAGIRNSIGVISQVHTHGHFWSEFTDPNARRLSIFSSGSNTTTYVLSFAISVRCVRDI